MNNFQSQMLLYFWDSLIILNKGGISGQSQWIPEFMLEPQRTDPEKQ